MPYPELLSGQGGPPPGAAFRHPPPRQPDVPEHALREPHLSQPIPAGPQPPQPQQMDSSAVKLTRGTSCVLCQQRKVRCDKNKPCANCVKAGVECRVIPPQPPRRRKKRLQEKDLIDRIKKYENLLSENGVKFDALAQDLKADSAHADEVEDLENDFEGLKTTPSASASPSANSQGDGPRSNVKWFGLHKEFRASEKLLHDSSEEEIDGSTIHHAFDKMFSAQDGFPFMVGARYSSVISSHPSTVHMFQLWQIYIDNINTLLKITHVPTVQPQFIEAASRLEKAPKNIEALMFGIYLMALTSLEEDDVQARFYESKKDLLGRYFIAVQQALVNADFMRANDPITLQAFFLYLLAVRWFVDPRQVFCLLGILIRIAQRMGLHQDPGGYGLPPFEVEQRRRLWWAIVGYDRRIGEMTGSTISALSSGGDCKPPLNVNDSELHVDGKDMPSSHSGPTEMLFALTRIELSMAVASNSNRDSLKFNNGDKTNATAKDAAKPSGPTIKIAGQDGPAYTLDGFCAHIEGAYLQHCDPKIPLHFFTLTMTRQALCKMRVLAFLVRLHDSESMPLQEVERDSLFLQATQMIEYDNVVQSSESLQPFKWYSMHFFPFPAYMFLVNELRNRIVGPMVERAWDAITQNYHLRGLLNRQHSPMHVAFSGLFIKAWATHEQAVRSSGKDTIEPPFITALKERAEKRRQSRQPHGSLEPSAEKPIDLPQGDRALDGTGLKEDPSLPPSDRRGIGVTGPPLAPNAAMSPTMGAPSAHSATPEQADDMDWSYMMGGEGMPFGGFAQMIPGGPAAIPRPMFSSSGPGMGGGNMSSMNGSQWDRNR